MNTPLVRSGEDFWWTRDPKTGAQRHTMRNVYREMLLQICRDYAGLPDPRTLRNVEIRFFYEGSRDSLKRATAPTKPKR